MAVKIRSASSVKEFEKRFEEKKGGSTKGIVWPTRLGGKRGNALSVRFLTDETEWAEFAQYWVPALSKYVIETEENEEGYQEMGLRRSWVTLAGALDIETGQVIVIQMPYSLAKEVTLLRKKYEDKNGAALVDLDIELVKRGEGQDTEYRAAYEGKSEMDLSRFAIPNGAETWKTYLWDLVARMAGEVEDDADDSEDDLDDDTEAEDEATESKTEPKTEPKRVLRRRV